MSKLRMIDSDEESRKHWVTFGLVNPWPWKRAKATFLKRHHDLMAKMRAVV